jgi:hypothetical protein
MIYFMRARDGRSIKIGYSRDVKKRRTQLQQHYKRPLVVLAVLKGGRAEEAELHARFAHLRYEGTEQFRPGRELMEFLGFPSTAGSDDSLMPDLLTPAMRQRLGIVVLKPNRVSGATLALNLLRLGWAEMIVRVKVSKLCAAIARSSGGAYTMNRQRINTLLRSETIRPETLKRIADAIGVKPEELTRV